MPTLDASALPAPVLPLVDAWNQHDLPTIVGCFSTGYEGEDVLMKPPVRGHPGIREATFRYLSAFPDLRLKLHSCIRQGHQIMVSWDAFGTHQGAFLGIPATQRPVHIRGVWVLHIRQGKIVQGHVLWDVASVLRTLRLLPELAPQPANRTYPALH